MTVSTTTNKVSYSGTGSQTVFAYGFKIFADGDLDVYIRDTNGTETLQTITTHYTVSGAGSDSGGNVTFVTAPGSTDTVVIQRKLDLTQGTDYVANDPFPAASHEDALDRLTFITQQIQEEVDRSIKASVTNTISSSEFAISASDRANKIFAFDASGDLAVTQEIGTFRGNWAASTDYEQRDLVKDTSTNNIFIVNTAHTSSGAQPLTTNANSAKYDLIVDAASATTSATTATTQATAAAASATAAAASESAAATSETNAATSESNASTSETNAATSATAAASSATAASTAQTAAETAQAAAETAETNAETAETNAETAQTAAETAQTAAETAQTAAETAETNAATSATTATTKASEAATSATNAATSATSASTAQTAAETAQTAAETAQAAAELAADNFDDTYLGAKSSDPTVDNDGDALTAGDLYFNTTSDQLKYYTGSAWVAIAPGIANVSEDTTPQLGGDLDVQTNSIVSTSNRDINISPNGTGTVVINTDLDVDNININGNTISSTDTNGDINLTPNGTGDVVLGGDVKIGDSDVLYIGDGLDLQIQHSGAGSFITDAGTGDLHIRSDDALRIQNTAGSENKAVFTSNGAVTLYHDNSAKISTASTGIHVTGNVDASGTVFGTNQILQVKKVTLSSTTQLTSSGAAHELSTSLRLAITPKASDSLLYLNFFAPFTYPNSNNLQYAYFYNVTGTAAVGIPAAGGSRMATTWHKRTTAFDANDMDTLNMHAVITADNTNARTYTIYHRTEGAVAQFLQSTLSSAAGTNTVAFFWIMEVAA